MISLLRGWLGWALGAVAAGVAVVAAIVTTGTFPGSEPDPSEPSDPPAEVAALPEASAGADAPADTETPTETEATAEPDAASETPDGVAPAEMGDTEDVAQEALPETPDEGETADASETPDNAPADEETDASADDATAPATTPDTEPPLFGNIRFPAAGIAVVAGQAAPGDEVVVFLDGAEVASVTANAAGDFAALFDLALSGVPRVVRIATRPDDGELVFAEDSRIVEPRQAPMQMAEAQDATEPERGEAPAQSDEVSPPEDNGVGEQIAMADTSEAEAPAQPEAPGTSAQAPVPPAETDSPGTDTSPVTNATPSAGATPDAGTAPEMAEAQTPGETAEAADVAEVAPTPAAPADTPPAKTPEVATADMAPQTPRVLRADRDGIRVIEDLGPADMPDLSLDAIAYDDAGEVTISGRGEGGQQVRLYLDNALVGDTTVGPDGQWRLTLPDSVDPGIYTMRVDEIGPDGGVTARVESPFKREDPEMLVAALGGDTGAVSETPEAPVAPDTETTEATDIPGVVDPAGAVTVDQPDGSEAPVAEVAETGGPTADAPEASEVAMAGAPDAPGEGDAVATDVDTDTPATDTVPAIQTADTAPEVPASEPMISAITVQPGSTLWAISRERYGDGLLYVQVFEANRDKIRDPDLIYPGQVFELPADVGDK